MKQFIRTLIAIQIIVFTFFTSYSQDNNSRTEPSTAGLKRITTHQSMRDIHIDMDEEALNSTIELAVTNAMEAVEIALKNLDIHIDPIDMDIPQLDIDIDPIEIHIPKIDIDIPAVNIDLGHDNSEWEGSDNWDQDDQDEALWKEKFKEKNKEKDKSTEKSQSKSAEKEKSKKSTDTGKRKFLLFDGLNAFEYSHKRNTGISILNQTTRNNLIGDSKRKFMIISLSS